MEVQRLAVVTALLVAAGEAGSGCFLVDCCGKTQVKFAVSLPHCPQLASSLVIVNDSKQTCQIKQIRLTDLSEGTCTPDYAPS